MEGINNILKLDIFFNEKTKKVTNHIMALQFGMHHS